MSLRSRRASVRASRWSVFTFTRAMACRASVWASVSLIAYARKRSTSHPRHRAFDHHPQASPERCRSRVDRLRLVRQLAIVEHGLLVVDDADVGRGFAEIDAAVVTHGSLRRPGSMFRRCVQLRVSGIADRAVALTAQIDVRHVSDSWRPGPRPRAQCAKSRPKSPENRRLISQKIRGHLGVIGCLRPIRRRESAVRRPGRDLPKPPMQSQDRPNSRPDPTQGRWRL